MSDLDPTKAATLLPGALAVVDEAIAAVKRANLERDDALAKLAVSQEELELVKVANSDRPVASIFTDEDIQETVVEVVDAGYCPPELATKFASDLKTNPKIALATVRRIAKLSTPGAPSTGQGVRKIANSSNSDDVQKSDDTEALSAEEIEAALRLRSELV